MSKKLLYTILAGVLSIGVLTACGEGAEDPAGGDPMTEEPGGLE